MRFERGDPAQPKGHALAYFQGSQRGAILASYIVALPIALHLGKYIPPVVASQIPGFGGSPPAVIPIPPVPEEVESLAQLQHLANLRDDDLIYAGTVDSLNMESTVRTVVDLAQRYLKLYEDYLAGATMPDASARDMAINTDLDTREVIYSLLGEHDRLQELSKLTGQLRYAIDGADAPLIAGTVHQMERLAKYLPAKYRIGEFIDAAQTPGDHGRRMAELHMERCYKLFHEDYVGLGEIEQQLKRLDKGES